MKPTSVLTLAALALGLASAATAQNRPAATPAAASSSASSNASTRAQTVQNALTVNQPGLQLANAIREDGLNICAKKADKKKCGPASP